MDKAEGARKKMAVTKTIFDKIKAENLNKKNMFGKLIDESEPPKFEAIQYEGGNSDSISRLRKRSPTMYSKD